MFAENHFEPLFFGPDNDRFGWWFGLGENWPRGQLSSLMMMNEIGSAGAWSQPFTHPNLDKFKQPTVRGVDYPALGLAQAWNDLSAGVLYLGTYAATSAKNGEATRFTVENLPDAAQVAILCDGQKFSGFTVLDAKTIRIDTTIKTHNFQIYTGCHAPAKAAGKEPALSHISGGAAAQNAQPHRIKAEAVLASIRTPSLSTGCPCC